MWTKECSLTREDSHAYFNEIETRTWETFFFSASYLPTTTTKNAKYLLVFPVVNFIAISLAEICCIKDIWIRMDGPGARLKWPVYIFKSTIPHLEPECFWLLKSHSTSPLYKSFNISQWSGDLPLFQVTKLLRPQTNPPSHLHKQDSDHACIDSSLPTGSGPSSSNVQDMMSSKKQCLLEPLNTLYIWGSRVISRGKPPWLLPPRYLLLSVLSSMVSVGCVSPVPQVLSLHNSVKRTHLGTTQALNPAPSYKKGFPLNTCFGLLCRNKWQGPGKTWGRSLLRSQSLSLSERLVKLPDTTHLGAWKGQRRTWDSLRAHKTRRPQPNFPANLKLGVWNKSVESLLNYSALKSLIFITLACLTSAWPLITQTCVASALPGAKPQSSGGSRSWLGWYWCPGLQPPVGLSSSSSPHFTSG